jgi:hypothetical protein
MSSALTDSGVPRRSFDRVRAPSRVLLERGRTKQDAFRERVSAINYHKRQCAASRLDRLDCRQTSQVSPGQDGRHAKRGKADTVSLARRAVLVLGGGEPRELLPGLQDAEILEVATGWQLAR